MYGGTYAHKMRIDSHPAPQSQTTHGMSLCEALYTDDQMWQSTEQVRYFSEHNIHQTLKYPAL